MKRFMALMVVASLSLATIGCENKKGTTDTKAETKTSTTQDGKTVDEKKVTTETKTAAPPTTDGSKTTTTTTETTPK